MELRSFEVSPDVLEKREFDFSSYQRDQIKIAKAIGKSLNAEVVNIGGRTLLFNLEVIL